MGERLQRLATWLKRLIDGCRTAIWDLSSAIVAPPECSRPERRARPAHWIEEEHERTEEVYFVELFSSALRLRITANVSSVDELATVSLCAAKSYFVAQFG
jgi:hypothetical protein